MNTTSTVPGALVPFLTVQDWTGYTEEQHAVWRALVQRRIPALRSTASEVFMEGMDAIGLDSERLPDLKRVNASLGQLTGWAAIPVTGFIPAATFFESLAKRRFPTTVTTRPVDRLDYVPEPDIFHDVFGHVPLHALPAFADYLQRFGRVASEARSPDATTAMARLFWFTVEFGLIRERGQTRVYGSGLISSKEDAENALGPTCDRRPFSLGDVIEQPFDIDRLQDVLFEIDGFAQLDDAMRELAEYRW